MPTERRKYPRRRCALPVEVVSVSGHYRSSGQTTDVSPNGCYIQMLFTIPTGTRLDVTLWVGGEKITGQGLVRAEDRGVGIGIEFDKLAPADRARIQAYLDAVPDEVGGDDALIIR